MKTETITTKMQIIWTNQSGLLLDRYEFYVPDGEDETLHISRAIASFSSRLLLYAGDQLTVAYA